MDAPPGPEIDDWIGSLEQDLGGYSPALASGVPVHPPADAPGGEPVTRASGAVGAAAPPEQPVAGTAGKNGASQDLWLEQVDAHRLGSVGENVAALPGEDQVTSVLVQKTNGLEQQLDALLTRAAELASLRERLNQVDELSSRTGAQLDALQKSRADLETFREEIHAFHTSRADIMKAAEKLAADRTAFEGFVQRVDDFQQRVPALEAEMDTISAKWSLKEKVLTAWEKKTDSVEERLGRLLTQAAALQQK